MNQQFVRAHLDINQSDKKKRLKFKGKKVW